MVVVGKVMRTGIRAIGLGVLTTLLAFLLSTTVIFAAPTAPTIGVSDWRTGELDICYSGVTPGYTLILYAKTYSSPTYTARDAWTATATSECHLVDPFENGQAVWHYVVQIDPLTAEESPPSNIGKQTPPITAYIINWPDMFGDLAGMLNDANQALQDKLDSLFTPSQQAMDDLADAVNGLKDAVGVGAVTGAAGQIQSGLGQIGSNLSPPAAVDDGNGTFSGGAGGPHIPNSGQTLGNLIGPNPDSGTDTETTIRLPYGVDMQGNLVYVKLFTAEQMEKLKWLGWLRTLAEAIIFIVFAFWLIARFSPQLKA